jgi:hypothetical protein
LSFSITARTARGVCVALGRQHDVDLSRVHLVTSHRGEPAPLEAVGHLARRLSGHADGGAEPADRHGPPLELTDRCGVTAAVFAIALGHQTTGHLGDPALAGEAEQVTKAIVDG